MAIKRTKSGKIDKRTKEGKAACARMAKARKAKKNKSLEDRLYELYCYKVMVKLLDD